MSVCWWNEGAVGAVVPRRVGETSFFRRVLPPTDLCCGAKGTSKTTNMETTQPFNQKQRDVFARMLVQAKERAQADLESETAMNDRVEDEVMLKLAEEKRCDARDRNVA